MRIFGLEVSRLKKALPTSLSPVSSRGGWWPVIRESSTGAWQRNIEVGVDCALNNPIVYSCITLISADIGKLRWKLMERDDNGVWSETVSPAFSPVLKKPNRYQTHIQHKEAWIISKLAHGNSYALKQRDARGIVTALYLLDPCRTKPLVAEDGSVFYSLQQDNINGLETAVVVPASEIIHDRGPCLFHPLVGVSAIFAAGFAALHGLKIQSNSVQFFGNMSRPSGILAAPGSISDETAKRLKTAWDENYSGDNFGKVAVLGDNLKFEPMAFNAVDSQLVEQLKWSAETICACFHIPAYMVGAAPLPSISSVEALTQEYYQRCLQKLIEDFEACMDEGLGLDTAKDGRTYGTELDLTGLLRMDQATQVKVLTDGLNGGLYTTNEARARLDLKPVDGGDEIWRQQQYYAISALAERDRNDPFAKPATPAPAVAPVPPVEPDDQAAKALAAAQAEARHLLEQKAAADLARAEKAAETLAATQRDFAERERQHQASIEDANKALADAERARQEALAAAQTKAAAEIQASDERAKQAIAAKDAELARITSEHQESLAKLERDHEAFWGDVVSEFTRLVESDAGAGA